MKTIRLFAAAAMLTASTCALAQFSNAGVSSKGAGTSINTDNYSRFEVSFASTDIQHFEDPLIGFEAGVIYGQSISKSVPLFLEYGLNLTWTTRDLAEEDDYYYDDYELRFTTMNIAVPLNLAYKFTFPSNSDIALTPFVGLNFKVNVMALESYDDGYDDETLNWFDKDDVGKVTTNRFQLGMNLGVGLSYQKIYFGYRFQPDFGKFDKYCKKTHTNYVSVGINF